MGILYQKIACANGADFGVWSVAERRTPFETAKIHAAGANELSPKVAGTSRGTWQVPREVGMGYLAGKFSDFPPIAARSATAPYRGGGAAEAA